MPEHQDHTSDPARRNRRTRKLIKSGMQLRLILSFAIVGCLSALFQIVLLNRSFMALSKKMMADGDVLLNELPVVMRTNLMLTMAVLLPTMLLVGLAVTHRIAGPIYGIERYLERVARGEAKGQRCKIRKGDELHELCDKVNDALDAVRAESRTTEADEASADSRQAA